MMQSAHTPADLHQTPPTRAAAGVEIIRLPLARRGQPATHVIAVAAVRPIDIAEEDVGAA